jgi:hypothetical protein
MHSPNRKKKLGRKWMWPVSVLCPDIGLKVLVGSHVVPKVMIPIMESWMRTPYLSNEVSRCYLLHIRIAGGGVQTGSTRHVGH